jgi:hypothetical protein
MSLNKAGTHQLELGDSRIADAGDFTQQLLGRLQDLGEGAEAGLGERFSIAALRRAEQDQLEKFAVGEGVSPASRKRRLSLSRWPR